MENRRFVLLALLGVTLFFLYQAWQKDYGPKPLASAPPAQTVPSEDVPTAGKPAPAATPKVSAEAAVMPAGGERIRVETDVLHGEISLTGGDLRRLEFLGYPETKDHPERNVALIDDREGRWFVVQSGLTGPAEPLVTQRSAYTAEQKTYRLADGADTLEVPLQYTANGIAVRKVYRFHRGVYTIDLAHTVKNTSGAALSVSPYVQLWRTPFAVGEEPPFIKSFMGLGVYEQKSGSDSYRFRKIDFEDVEKEPLQTQQAGGWLVMMQHYFLAAVIPPANETHSFIAKPSSSQGYLGQYVGPAADIADNAEQTFTTGLYIGPKLQRRIKEIAPGFELTVDYGILTPIAAPLFWLLDWFHKLTRNWGAAIILLTLSVKLALYKLSEAQYRSMAKMRKFGPRIQDIKERYGDDRERLQKAMMDLYKKEKFNPLAGCWPLVIQFPVFIALYWVLLDSVELRQASFVLWLSDLSAADPYYVLPVLFGASMWAQQKLSGQAMAMDPMQQKIMNLMPIMLTAFFTFFPAGLVLYWLVSNVAGISQQWYITRKLEKEGLGHR